MIEIHTKTTPKIKFQSEQRINEIQSGHIYMKELDYFRILEQDEGDLDVGDMAEAIPFSTAYETPSGIPCTLRVMDGTKSNYVMCLMERILLRYWLFLYQHVLQELYAVTTVHLYQIQRSWLLPELILIM